MESIHLDDFIIKQPNDLYKVDTISPTVHIYYTRNDRPNRVFHSEFDSTKFYEWDYHLYLTEHKKGTIAIIHIGDKLDAIPIDRPDIKLVEIQRCGLC